MIKDILSFIGGAFGMIIKFILIIGLSAGGVYCFGTLFMFPFIWKGLIRLGISAACVLAIIGLLRIGREKDDDGGEITKDDFRP
ncbi:MAG: hypothetical protein IKE15_03960 [Clostridia bacterium]|nr:hypothetical protein [Clostridia bacterium]